ncbi:MAG: hypothetical protein H0A76_12660 [Candidatus Thiodubiliella endoseptemdiera]|uniref:Uncharacterized protein n=1 Tax=Candidatus Thiodubiliella endoseptemdiera TaxID=2738886 RepID=A0A853F3M8_9GAMM|nr:hypothetical protein [Candidatus Thiodubiliella endoseptemdiera]
MGEESYNFPPILLILAPGTVHGQAGAGADGRQGKINALSVNERVVLTAVCPGEGKSGT